MKSPVPVFALQLVGRTVWGLSARAHIGARFPASPMAAFGRPDSDEPVRLAYVCYWGYSGKHMLDLRFTAFDPSAT